MVAHLKGGTGKTCTAISMAALLAAEGRDVLFLDSDVKGSQGSRLFRRREEYRKLHPELNIPEIPFVQVQSREHLESTVLQCRANFEDVVIDTNPTSGEEFATALTISDVAIHPIRLGHTEMESFGPLEQILWVVNEQRRRLSVRLLVSRSLLTDFRTTKMGRIIKDALVYKKNVAYLGEILHSEKFGEAILNGLAIWEYSPSHNHSKFVKEIILGCVE